jgi:hypothetical protein
VQSTPCSAARRVLQQSSVESRIATSLAGAPAVSARRPFALS